MSVSQAGMRRATVTVEARAKRRFPPTDDLRDAGWMTPDGTLLNFKRRAYTRWLEGDQKTPQRGYDHNDIDLILPQQEIRGCNEEAFAEAFSLGFARVGEEGSGRSWVQIGAGQQLTSAQIATLADSVATSGVRSFTVEVYDPCESHHVWGKEVLGDPSAVRRLLGEGNRRARGETRTRMPRTAWTGRPR